MIGQSLRWLLRSDILITHSNSFLLSGRELDRKSELKSDTDFEKWKLTLYELNEQNGAVTTAPWVTVAGLRQQGTSSRFVW